MANRFHKGFGFTNRLISIFGINRLPVFMQILVIVVIMILFSGVQAFFYERTLNTVLSSTEKSSTYGLNHIAKIMQNVYQLQVEYLELVENKLSSARHLLLKVKLIEQLVNITPNINKQIKKDVARAIESIKSTIQQKPNRDTYNAFKESSLKILENIGSMLEGESSSSIVNKTKNLQYLSQSRINSIIIMLISTIISLIFGLMIAFSISAPLKQIVQSTSLLAQGNLAQEINAKGSPEINRVVDGLNRAIQSLRDLAKNINQQSVTLYTASRELKTVSAETGRSASEVAVTIGDLAKGASDQSEQINYAVETIHLVSNTIKKVTGETENLTRISKRVSEFAKTGITASKDIVDEIHGLYDSAKDVDRVIEELSQATEDIDKTTVLIRSIAEQTTLIALNAAIEAARAGEFGRGFGVVAKETGKLAAQTKQAAGSIADLVKEIKDRTGHAVNAMNKGMEMAENGKNLANHTHGTFAEIFQSLNGMLTQIDAVADAASVMTESNQTMIDSISSIAAISQESLASTEEVSAVTEEQTASVQQVSELAEKLNDIASQLNEAIKAFKYQ
jgi:methyl-accepting chemotaxis protein